MGIGAAFMGPTPILSVDHNLASAPRCHYYLFDAGQRTTATDARALGAPPLNYLLASCRFLQRNAQPRNLNIHSITAHLILDGVRTIQREATTSSVTSIFVDDNRWLLLGGRIDNSGIHCALFDGLQHDSIPTQAGVLAERQPSPRLRDPSLRAAESTAQR